MDRFQKAVEFASQNPNTVARRIAKAGADDVSLYLFSQKLYGELHNKDAEIADMFADELKRRSDLHLGFCNRQGNRLLTGFSLPNPGRDFGSSRSRKSDSIEEEKNNSRLGKPKACLPTRDLNQIPNN